MAVSLRQTAAVGSYILRQRLAGRKRYPLVLMLEPLFRCNLTCFGCGKIDYPDTILNKRLSVQECLDAVDECGAPMVAIPGGEPLIHKEIGEIVKGIVARKKFVSLCTNALLLEKKLHLFEPSPYLFFSRSSALVHSDTNFLRATIPLTISPISLWISGSPPGMATIGAPHSSTASRHSCTERRLFKIASG